MRQDENERLVYDQKNQARFQRIASSAPEYCVKERQAHFPAKTGKIDGKTDQKQIMGEPYASRKLEGC